MERKVNIQDVIDALGMAEQLVSINGEPSCSALMALYTDPSLSAIGAMKLSGPEEAMRYVREDPDAPDSGSCVIVSDEDAKTAAVNILKTEKESGLGIYVRDLQSAKDVIEELFK